MKLARYIIEALVSIACAYCAWYLCSTVDTWEADDSMFYIFAIGGFIVFAIICVCDIIENIYYSRK